METLQEKINKVIRLTGMRVLDIAIATRLPVDAMFKWKTGTMPRNPEDYNRLVSYLDNILMNDSNEDAGNKPVFQERRSIAETLHFHLGRIDRVIEVSGDNMLPTLSQGTLVLITHLPNPRLLNWSGYYYIVDKNGEGIVQLVYAGENENNITLLSDNPDQVKYPPITREWDAIEAIQGDRMLS